MYEKETEDLKSGENSKGVRRETETGNNNRNIS